MSVGLCYCRHKMSHVGRACDAPLDICMTFGPTAASLAKHGHARAVDAAEGLDLLGQAYEHNLVQFGENAREGVSFICNCCGCCCEAMIAARRFAVLHPIHTTNFLPEVDESCLHRLRQVRERLPGRGDGAGLGERSRASRTGAGRAWTRASASAAESACGRATGAVLKLRPRARRVVTPVNSAHRTVVMAIERGKLQHLIFDNQAHLSHRALAAILGRRAPAAAAPAGAGEPADEVALPRGRDQAAERLGAAGFGRDDANIDAQDDTSVPHPLSPSPRSGEGEEVRWHRPVGAGWDLVPLST